MVSEDLPTSKKLRKQTSPRRFRFSSLLNIHFNQRRHSKLALGTTVGWLASSLAIPAYAADMAIGNGGVRFNRDTTLETDFVESHGAYQSTFGVLNLDTNEKTPLLVETKSADQPASIFNPSSKTNHVGTSQDFLGTPQGAVSAPAGKYTFKANTNYVFYLESTYKGRPTGTVYSSDVMNPNKERQVTFSGNPTNFCQSNGLSLAWDDTGSKLVRDRAQQDRDFDDFIVRLRDTACPIGGGESPASAVAPPESIAPPVGALPGAVAPAAAGGGVGGLTIPLGLLGAGAIAGLATALGGGDNGNNNNNQPPAVVTPGGGGETPGGGGTGTPGGGIPGGGGGTPGGGGGEGEPIPEPLTVLGSGAAIGFAAMLRRRARGRKKDLSKN
jgi:hypothetical protein